MRYANHAWTFGWGAMAALGALSGGLPRNGAAAEVAAEPPQPLTGHRIRPDRLAPPAKRPLVTGRSGTCRPAGPPSRPVFAVAGSVAGRP